MRLFHDVQPKARLFSTILPPQSGVGQSPIGSFDGACGSWPVREQLLRRLQRDLGLAPRWRFQITNPQPGSVFDLYDVQPNDFSRSTISPPQPGVGHGPMTARSLRTCAAISSPVTPWRTNSAASSGVITRPPMRFQIW